MANPNTDTMQYMDLFSHLTVHEPSVSLFQKQELAVCRPAPFFCIIMQVTERNRGSLREGLLHGTGNQPLTYIFVRLLKFC